MTTAVACPSPQVPGLLLPLRFARRAASRSARSEKNTFLSYLGSLWRNSRPGPKGPVRRLLECLRRLAVVARKPKLGRERENKEKKSLLNITRIRKLWQIDLDFPAEVGRVMPRACISRNTGRANSRLKKILRLGGVPRQCVIPTSRTIVSTIAHSKSDGPRKHVCCYAATA